MLDPFSKVISLPLCSSGPSRSGDVNTTDKKSGPTPSFVDKVPGAYVDVF